MPFASLLPTFVAGRAARRPSRLTLLPVFAASWLAFSRPAAAALPLNYLPDGTTMLISVHLQEVCDSSFYQNMKKEIPDFSKGEAGFAAESGVAPEDIAQVTMAGNLAGKGDEGQPTIIIKTRSAITADKIRETMKPQSYQKDFKIDQIKAGQYTIYDPSFQFQFQQAGGKTFHGEAFVVVENDVVLESRNIESLKKILQRGKPAELSETMHGLLKDADAAKTLVYAIDLKTVAGDEEFAKNLQRNLGLLLEKNGEMIKAVESFALDGSLKGDDSVLRATLVCKDAATADDAKKAVEGAQEMLRMIVKASPRAPHDVAASVDSVALTVDGAKIKADGKVNVLSLAKWARSEYENARKQAMDRTEELRRSQEQAQPQ
jgi:hypothetical protein